MTKPERAAHVSRRLEELYPETPIPLDHTDSFTLLIAVLLSAQCTDVRVNQITPALFARANTPQAMMKVPEEEIREIIRPCGLSPQKSSAISRLSRILVEEHGGGVPADFDALEALPGVGHKTASVVMSQAFGVPAFPVDTHIHRLAKRWKLSSGKNVVQTERDLKKLFPRDRWNKLHLQIIFYGREYCSARGCDGTKCPICRELSERKTPAKS
ncbi:endonuclease III [Luteolibacter ambystomatis]|uniref:Endonuclease III n=1 Tax=Luteolibacter ambystomatis TaxID=2824561 RepID=A0A975G8D7_9BACT|nr:endonuclease III [Luteolibacter ambystomatis]QUE50693.1 endonuclease III [Luteolibacter ambystomatis]